MTLSEVCVFLSTICWSICLLPQIIKVWKAKKVGTVSILLFTFSLAGHACFEIGTLLAQDYFYFFVDMTPTVLCGFLLCMLCYFYMKNEPRKN